MARPMAIVAGTMIRAVSRCIRPDFFSVGEAVTRMVRDLRVTEPASLHYVKSKKRTRSVRLFIWTSMNLSKIGA